MDSCREEGLGDQETLLRRRTRVEEKVSVRWGRGKIFQTKGTEMQGMEGRKGVALGFTVLPCG